MPPSHPHPRSREQFHLSCYRQPRTQTGDKPWIVSMLFFFNLCDTFEKNWSTSSCVWPTGRKLILTCNNCYLLNVDFNDEITVINLLFWRFLFLPEESKIQAHSDFCSLWKRCQVVGKGQEEVVLNHWFYSAQCPILVLWDCYHGATVGCHRSYIWAFHVVICR